MATIEVSGIELILNDIDRMNSKSSEARKKILTAEADILEPAIRQAIRSEGLVRSGKLLESIERSEKMRKQDPVIIISPIGEHHRYVPSRGKGGIVNSAQVGYLNNYGLPRRHIRARNFIEKAIRLSEERMNDAAEKAYDEFLKSINL